MRLPVCTKVRVTDQAGLAVLLLLLAEEVDRVAIERVVDRGFGHGDDRRLVRQHHGGGHEHAGLEDPIRIVDRRLHANVARFGRDLRLDGGDLALEGAARIGIDRDTDDLADLELAGVLLRHGEVRIQHRQIGQRDDLRARGQILSDLDLANAEFAVERRPHQLLRDDRLGLGDAGAGLIERRLRGIHRRLRSDLALRQLLGAVQRDLRHALLRLEVGEVALLGTVEHLHQRRALFHAGARREQDFGDAAVDVGRDIDLMHGGEIADRGQEVRNGFGLRRGDVDAGRRRLVVREELRDHLAAEVVEPDQTADQQGQQQSHDDEPAHQPHRPLVRLVGDRLARKFGFSHDIHVMHFLQLPIVPNSATARSPDEKQLRPR